MKPLRSLAKEIREGKASSEELITHYLKGVEEKEGDIQAFLHLPQESIIEEARRRDQAPLSQRKGRLYGIPVAIKDNITTKGLPTTCASRILKNFIPPYDATVIQKLKEEGAVIFGKTNCDEFAMGSSTEYSAYQVTHNPLDLERVPGGSSGGSAAAVASGMVPLALGSDTGGSIRQPAAFCGVVGVKPTYGRVSRFGLVAFASSLDVIGPLATTVDDAALLFEVISGYDPQDSTSLQAPTETYQNLTPSLKGRKIGFIQEVEKIEGVAPPIQALMDKAKKVIQAEGGEVVSVSIPLLPMVIPIYYIIANAEASSNLARYDGIRYGVRIRKETLRSTYVESRTAGLGPEVKRRILMGTFVLSSGYYEAYYQKAKASQKQLRQQVLQALNHCDALILPTTPEEPFKLGEKLDDPIKMYLSDIFTVAINLAGVPAISLPFLYPAKGFPWSLQVVGKPLDERTLFGIAKALETNA